MATSGSELWAGDFPTVQDFFAAADQAENREVFIVTVRDNTCKRIAERTREQVHQMVEQFLTDHEYRRQLLERIARDLAERENWSDDDDGNGAHL
jgi:hypothetical protein